MIGSNYRFYTFINFYLSSIQQGIQSAHLVSELFAKYSIISLEREVIQTWAQRDKTIIVLNGGTTENLTLDIKSAYEYSKLNREFCTPCVEFYEDEKSLGIYDKGILTGFGIVVPEEMWDAKEVHQQTNMNAAVNNFYSQTKYRYVNIESCKEGQVPKSKWIDYDWMDSETRIIDLIRSKNLAR